MDTWQVPLAIEIESVGTVQALFIQSHVKHLAAQLDLADDESYPCLPSSKASTPSSQITVSNKYTPLFSIREPNTCNYQPPAREFKVNTPNRINVMHTPRSTVDRSKQPSTKPVQIDRLSAQERSHLSSLLKRKNSRK
ncbi:hypothetical protein J6590_040033 [Homalodisca vitripennis]|nr:hypothetical protein J6590_040033 [Homalodisca vitripennis]